ncbi:MAG: hypothetical protein V2A79_09460 [Planctomycetota bacterium]
MATNAYCSETQFKLRAGIPAGSAHDDEADRSIESASRAVDRYCGRRFYQDSVVSARTFTPDHGTYLSVDDVSTLTGLVVKSDDDWDGTFENTWTLNSRSGPYGFMVEPPNAIADGKPVTRLHAVANSWPTLPQGVEVTAKWGWAAPPTDVVEATLILASRYFKRKDAPFGVMGTAETGFTTLPSIDPDVKALLSPYRRMDDA